MKKYNIPTYRYLSMFLVYIISLTVLPHKVLAESTFNEVPIIEEHKTEGKLEYNYASKSSTLTMNILTSYINEGENVNIFINDSKGNPIISSEKLSFQSEVKVTTPGAIGIETSTVTTAGAISIVFNTNGKATVDTYSLYIKTEDQRESNKINFKVTANEDAVLQNVAELINSGIEDNKNSNGKLTVPLEYCVDEDFELTFQQKFNALSNWIRTNYFYHLKNEFEDAGLPMLHMLRGYWGDGNFYYGFALNDDVNFSYHYVGDFSDLTVIAVPLEIMEYDIIVNERAVVYDVLNTLQNIADQAIIDNKPIPLYVNKTTANATITTADKIKALEVWAWKSVVNNMPEKAPLHLIELDEVVYNEIRDEFFIGFKFKDKSGNSRGNFHPNSFNFIANIVNGDNDSGSDSKSDSDTSDTANVSTNNDLIQKQLKNNKEPSVTLKNSNICELNAKTISSIIEQDLPLTIKKDNISMVLTPETITSTGINDAKKITISITPVTKTRDLLDEENSTTRFFNKLVYDIRIKSDNKEITSFEKPIELYYDFKNTEVNQSDMERATGARFHGDNKYNQLGGTWNKNVFSFYTSSLSSYGVIVSDDLVTISTQINNPSFMVNNHPQIIDTAPIIVDGHSMVPVRFIAEAFGAEVDWNALTETVTIFLDGQQLSLKIGNINEGMKTAPFIENGRTMVPLRYISEQLGGNVLWDDDTKTVTIYR